jgi:hypothetical protein
MGSFICQTSESDWIVSRILGVYGNREGSDRERVVYFKDTKRGEGTIQSIIEDLIGMKKGDLVFFHVIDSREGESSIHGVYKISNEPFYDESPLWNSNPHFVYPYRFCFEPHPEHADLCEHDSSILVGEFYRSIENRDIRSVVTLEREVMGAAHAVKTIAYEDACEIIRLLYRDFDKRSEQNPVRLNPKETKMEPLRNHIRRIGEIEFPIKALVVYELGRRNPSLTQLIPACRDGKYDFLIESFVGQTARKPVDILCLGRRKSEKAVTILEAKVRLAGMEDLAQSMRYLDLFKTRNIDRGSLFFKMSACLLAQEFQSDLVNYASIRNRIIPWEEIVLLKYLPSQNGTDAEFSTETTTRPALLSSFSNYPYLDMDRFLQQLSANPTKAYLMLNKNLFRKASIELESKTENKLIFNKYCHYEGEKVLVAKTLLHIKKGTCSFEDFTDFLEALKMVTHQSPYDLIAIEPVIVAGGFDQGLAPFLEKYNLYEARAGKQPIRAYLSSTI